MGNVARFDDTAISLGQKDSVIRPTGLNAILHGLMPIYEDDDVGVWVPPAVYGTTADRRHEVDARPACP
eukprot:481325-Pyramimonas_sp.AAC.1